MVFGQSWKRRWFRISGADINYLVRMVAICLAALILQNEACCGELHLTKDSRICTMKPGTPIRPDATEASQPLELPEKQNLVELSGVTWMGRTRTFYIAFDSTSDMKQFILVVQNNIKCIIDGTRPARSAR